jgi:hypothetical protein
MRLFMGKFAQSIAPAPAPAGNSAAQIEYWKHGINLSMHFNDMCIRLRILSLTVLATFLAGAAVSMAQYPDGMIAIFGRVAHISVAIYFISAAFVALVWILDQLYYYRLLIASVENSEAVEPTVRDVVYDMVKGPTLTTHLTASIPRLMSRTLATSFYSVQLLITLGLIAWAFVFEPPSSGAAQAADTAPAQVAAPKADAATVEYDEGVRDEGPVLRGREP